MTTNKQTPERITIPESDWPMHEWSAADIVVAVEGCSLDDETRVVVVDAYGRKMPILGIRVRPGDDSVLEIVTDTDTGPDPVEAVFVDAAITTMEAPLMKDTAEDVR